ncbi:16S rRNA (guanine(966)-N(2))-methyltransferase RsmD [Caloramator sp. ALD01]|uniref:16S rRNA (guanine(966)-N(2))-methyltransferase RsmD n=1 Tax=Caloramator sp. ALD01 TaxID=1031288 RepID=UPI00040FE8E1|nr:16S rRNA (guanine(966)-N(2))-methyltransferase RsmD [Caloramator sp. ALD01]
MRIITGTARGRIIKAPEGLNTRPTSDRVKESMFNILDYHYSYENVLDLFAGSGNLGLEAISRGAKKCIFIEQNKEAYNYLVDNIKNLKFEDYCEYYKQDAFSAVEILAKRGEKFDLIFLDPPYGKGLVEKSIKSIYEKGLLDDNGVIVSEQDVNDVLPDIIGNIKKVRVEKYGRTAIAFWSKEE